MVSKFLYNLFLLLYSIGIRVSSVWNPKAKKWLSGRRNIFETINLQGPAHGALRAGSQTIWMHCASLGEFEQGRPLLEELRKNASAGSTEKLKIVLTFFSPSGYEVMKDYNGADHVFYLPMDSKENAKKFLDAVDPTLVLWVKYEYWYYYLSEIKQRQIPAILVSGIFRPGQPFFTWYGGIWKKMLETFTQFFLQNTASKQLLASLGFTENVQVNGDTRFDRVLEIAANFKHVPGIESFCGNNPVIVAGSTWDEDEIELLHFVKVNPHIKFIIAPHEISAARLADVQAAFTDSVFYSELVKKEGIENASLHSANPQGPAQGALKAGEQISSPHVLIIDNMGMLSRLYHYAAVTYVGGGFGADGVHNVLEAAVYGKPVVFGHEYVKFNEAVELLQAGGAVSVDGPVSLEKVLQKLLTDDEARKNTGDAARQFVLKNGGATRAIMQFIQEKRLLTN
ncbi:MAG: glycosyltransferase N-terminal domain-containing protein [Ferruginibacter sp.]